MIVPLGLTQQFCTKFGSVCTKFSNKYYNMKWIFKDKFDFDHRLQEASGILDKYPDKIPVSSYVITHPAF